MSNRMGLDQTAGLALLGIQSQVSDEARHRAMRQMLDLAFRSGAEKALKLVQEEYRKRHPGGCQMFSRGGNCDCHLCFIDRLLEDFNGA